MISKEKLDALQKRMEELQIRKEDLEEKFTLSSGPGGQNVQKTSTCVHLKHLPTGIEIKWQKERSRELNRFFARRALVEKLEKLYLGTKTKKEIEQNKIRLRKKRRERRRKE